jgi:hypothetical protein
MGETAELGARLDRAADMLGAAMSRAIRQNVSRETFGHALVLLFLYLSLLQGGGAPVPGRTGIRPSDWNICAIPRAETLCSAVQEKSPVFA